MYFRALAIDYDGTLAFNGKVSPATVEALVRIKASGRKLIMVTGRQLDDLKQIFDQLDIFDRIVAENGALIYTPQTESQQLLAKPPPEEFVEALRASGVTPLTFGKVIVATMRPQETTVLKVIRDQEVDLGIIFNKDSVMVLPSGVNKATGLAYALHELGLTMHNVVGIGDAENDHVFLRIVGLGIAVANANEQAKQSAGYVMQGAYGEAIVELVDLLLENEAALVAKVRHKIVVGLDQAKMPVELNPTDCVLIAGHSGIGKSTLATALTEKMVEQGFQFCIFDPEGDYEKLENAIGVGDIKSPPSQEQVMELLQDPSRNVVVNTLGIELKERPSFFIQLAPKLVSLKTSLGRPHWLMLDEAHYLMPAEQAQNSVSLPKGGWILVTVHPEKVSLEALKAVNVIIILGPQSQSVLTQLSQIMGEALPESSETPQEEELLVWQRAAENVIKVVRAEKPKQQHKRHTRKYAEGDLSDEFCFYFRGPKDALNLKAQNLMIFLQIAEGVDDATWMYHLEKGDYSDWFRRHIKDDRLADAAEQIEHDSTLSPAQSRQAIAGIVRELYTGPASAKD